MVKNNVNIENLDTRDIDIEGIVKSKGYYVANMQGRWNCHLGHFDIDEEDLADIIGDFYGDELDDGVKLHIEISRVDEKVKQHVSKLHKH